MDRYKIFEDTPRWMLFVGAFLIVTASIALLTAIRNGFAVLSLAGSSAQNLTQLAQMGDFFGGHLSASVGSLTLLVVIFSSRYQMVQQERNIARQERQSAQQAERKSFLDGVNLITQWDIQNPGCDQAMRLLDYYSRLALQSSDEELLLLLNTVITAQLRSNLEGKSGSYKSSNYPFAYEAVEKIRPLRERDGRAQKSRLKMLFDPSAGGGA